MDKNKLANKKFVVFLTSLGHLWLKKPILRSVQISIALVIIQMTIIIFFFSRLPPQIPLFYSQPWGEPQLASPQFLFLLPIISSLVLIINIILAAAFFAEEEFLTYCLSWSTSIVSLSSLITLVEIINITL